MVRQSRSRWLVPLVLVLLPACGGSSESKARKAHQELESWDATARLTSELSHRGALPSEYIKQVQQAIAQGRQQARQQAAQAQ